MRPSDRLRRTLAPLLAGLLFAALRDAADGLAIAVGSLLAPLADARLPDPGQLSAVGIGMALGGLAGGALARLRRLPHDPLVLVASVLDWPRGVQLALACFSAVVLLGTKLAMVVIGRRRSRPPR